MNGLPRKIILVTLGSIALALLLWADVPVEETVAASGCCKQKVGNNWHRINETFENCKSLNEADGDNVFEPTGNYWWDVSC
jgi:hypothetical protein